MFYLEAKRLSRFYFKIGSSSALKVFSGSFDDFVQSSHDCIKLIPGKLQPFHLISELMIFDSI